MSSHEPKLPSTLDLPSSPHIEVADFVHSPPVPDLNAIVDVPPSSDQDLDTHELPQVTSRGTWSHPSHLWRAVPLQYCRDAYGYGRIPAFWYTLNLPYNYLFEIHRFHQAVEECTNSMFPPSDANMDIEASFIDPPQLDSVSREAKDLRCDWVLNNPDIVAFLHAVRVELNVRLVLPHIVPPEEEQPFHYWLRFEWGSSGNPHVHGQGWVPNNPVFDKVFRDEDARQTYEEEHIDETGLYPTWAEAEKTIAEFYDNYVREMHPAKDSSGKPLYPFVIENLQLKHCARPQCINLLALLDDIFAKSEPDLTKVKDIVLALIEDGQRHVGHGDRPPRHVNEAPCARINKKNVITKTI